MTVSSSPSGRISVPGGTFVRDVPLVAVRRGSFVGSLHRGSIAIADVKGEVRASLGYAGESVFLRSAAKPFQVIPAVLSGGLDRYGISSRELAVLCASHSAELRHQEAVLSVLEKIGLDESALRCGVHPPLHEATARAMWSRRAEPTPVCNNCSGAHAGMLLACRAMDWPTNNYGDIDHPLQRLTLEILGAFAGVEPQSIEYAVDNCAVPTFRLPLVKAATAFARLATGESVRPELAGAAVAVRRAMTAFPEMVAGEDRFDTDVMEVAKGALISKGGAEAFQGIGSVARGWGIAFKISDGGSRAVPPAAVRILIDLGLFDPATAQRLGVHQQPRQHNWQGEIVGDLVPVFTLGEIR